MKYSNNKRSRFNFNIAALLSIVAAIAVSCSHMYDNVEKYVDGEIVYIDKLDGIIRVQVGYERVEIDLLRAGRIPSSQIRMAKSKKTVIECPDFAEPGHRKVMDSICSWVNVTGLTQLKFYELTIYTEDEYGNRSLPMKVSVKPYTVENLNTLEIIPPSINASSSSAQIEWLEGISALTHHVISYQWLYTDRDNAVITYGDDGDKPVIFLENIASETDIPVTMKCRIIPTLFNFDGSYTAIIDTIDFQTTLSFRLSSDADDVIFLKSPLPGAESDLSEDSPVTFAWTKTDAANGYKLKFSLLPTFPEGETYLVDVGDVGEYVMNNADMNDVFNSLSPTGYTKEFYWTVTPTEQGIPVKTSFRLLKFWKIGKYYEYNKIGWEAIETSSVLASYVGQNIIDNDEVSLWHSSGAALPEYIIIDMKTPKNIFKFDVLRRYDASPNYKDTKTVEMYLSNNPIALSNSWIKIGELEFLETDNTGDVRSQTYKEALTTDNVTEGRYLKVVLPNTYRIGGYYVSICEIYLYYK